MIGHVSRRVLAPMARNQQKRTYIPNLFPNAAENPVNKIQKEFQKGATPYLRGDADPTYLRKSSDGAAAGVMIGLAAVSWLLVGYNHIRLWGNKK